MISATVPNDQAERRSVIRHSGWNQPAATCSAAAAISPAINE